MNFRNIAVCIICFVLNGLAVANENPVKSLPQAVLLKDWALSRCIGQIAPPGPVQDDAFATASAYLEFSKQNIETYDEINKLISAYTAKQYGGSIPSSFNTMKCIDLFQSRELDELTKKLMQKK